ncbi:cyclic nucleotide-binding domain protein (macronuclear) [Tetrahymena thermophila SB210]|uniref:Cyclic nucleotide-binding domain protein n=1 Tax=Tetrahymena thermophila (strain SB210) TaxID=312017 RepID=Q24C45_TETTS|nr:cyclic nucleotide-binding domain protein [Tetrahymena thermophila SB210]EAS05393.2 cyclic nucleotide-binding domain protein [Tetrahymena thermophila SB210]|eukprot:XP_001025638.2 cyclic nucleotide-binding domain protein [Tetrahymena thermophila SB210]
MKHKPKKLIAKRIYFKMKTTQAIFKSTRHICTNVKQCIQYCYYKSYQLQNQTFKIVFAYFLLKNQTQKLIETNMQKLLDSERSQILSLQRDLIPLNSQNSKRQVGYNELNSKCTKENKPSIHKIVSNLELEKVKKNESQFKENQNFTSTYKSQFNTLETINKYRILDELKISLQKEIQNQEFLSISDQYTKNDKIYKFYYDICILLIYPFAIMCKIIPIMTQHSLINLIWDFTSIAFNMILFYLLSIKALIGYNSTENTVNIVVCWILFFVFILDIFKMLITSYCVNGQVYTLRKEIIKNYIFNGFIFDYIALIASIIGIFYYGTGQAYGEQNILEVIKFLKIITLVKRVKVLIERIKRQHSSGILFIITSIGTYLLIYFHILSICYFNIAYIVDCNSSNKSPQIWYYKYSINKQESYNLYMHGLYEIQNSLLGSSDVNSNSFQILFLIIVRILSIALFIYLIISVSTGQRKKNKQNFDHLKILNQNLSKSDQGYTLLNKIYSVISENQNKQDIFRQLSNFSKQIPQNIYQELKQYFFQNYFSSKIKHFSCYSIQINQMIPQIAEIQFLEKGQSVFLSGKFDECGGLSFYLIIEGEIELYQQPTFCSDMKKLYKVKKQGDIFGFQQFYTGQVRNSTVICKSNCILFKVNRQNFLELIKKYNQDFEIFHMIKDTFLNEYQNEWSKILDCSFCENFGHQNLSCPQVFYRPRVIKSIRVNQSEINQRDQNFKRSQHKNKQSILNRQQNFDAQKKYFLQNEEILLEYLVNYTDILNYINYEEENTQSKSKQQIPIRSNSVNDLEKAQISFNLIPQKISKFSDYKGDLDDLELLMRLDSSTHSIGITKKQSERLISAISATNEKAKRPRSQIEQQSIFKVNGQKLNEDEEGNNNQYYNSFASNSEHLSVKDIQENFFDSPRNNQSHSFSQASCSLFDNIHNNGNNTICTQSLGIQNDKSIVKSLIQQSLIKRINSGIKEQINPSLIFRNAGILQQIKQNLNIQDSKFNQTVHNIILDQIQEYKYYFPNGNITNVLKNYNRQIRYLQIQSRQKILNKIEKDNQPPQLQLHNQEENAIYIDCINTSHLRKANFQDSYRSSMFNLKNISDTNNNILNFQISNNDYIPSVNIIQENKQL